MSKAMKPAAAASVTSSYGAAMGAIAPFGIPGDGGASLYGDGLLEIGALIAGGRLLGTLLGGFSAAMAAPTQAGRHLLDRVAGLELYLGTAEAERLEALHPLDRTPEPFEQLLPYAIDLDLVPSWTAQFAGARTGAGAALYVGARPDHDHFARTLDRDLQRGTERTAERSGGGSGSGGGPLGGGGGSAW